MERENNETYQIKEELESLAGSNSGDPDSEPLSTKTWQGGRSWKKAKWPISSQFKATKRGKRRSFTSQARAPRPFTPCIPSLPYLRKLHRINPHKSKCRTRSLAPSTLKSRRETSLHVTGTKTRRQYKVISYGRRISTHIVSNHHEYTHGVGQTSHCHRPETISDLWHSKHHNAYSDRGRNFYKIKWWIQYTLAQYQQCLANMRIMTLNQGDIL